MELTKEQVKAFQKLYKQHFGESISFAEARKQGAELVQLVELVFKPTNTLNE